MRAESDLGVYFEGYSASVSGFSPKRDLAKSLRWFQGAAGTYRRLVGPGPSAENLGLRIRFALSLHDVAVIASETERRAEAPCYDAEGHDLLEEVLRIEPNNDEAVLAMGITLLNWGSYLTVNAATKADGEGLILKAIDRLKPLVEVRADLYQAKILLCDCYRTLANFEDARGQFTKCATLLGRRVALANGELKEEFRTCQALDLARSGEHRKAWNLACSLEPHLKSLTQHYRYGHRLVAAVSPCMIAAEKDQSLSTKERAAICLKYGDKGADLLRRVLDLAPIAERGCAPQRASGNPNGAFAPPQGR